MSLSPEKAFQIEPSTSEQPLPSTALQHCTSRTSGNWSTQIWSAIWGFGKQSLSSLKASWMPWSSSASSTPSYLSPAAPASPWQTAASTLQVPSWAWAPLAASAALMRLLAGIHTPRYPFWSALVFTRFPHLSALLLLLTALFATVFTGLFKAPAEPSTLLFSWPSPSHIGPFYGAPPL